MKVMKPFCPSTRFKWCLHKGGMEALAVCIRRRRMRQSCRQRWRQHRLQGRNSQGIASKHHQVVTGHQDGEANHGCHKRAVQLALQWAQRRHVGGTGRRGQRVRQPPLGAARCSGGAVARTADTLQEMRMVCAE